MRGYRCGCCVYSAQAVTTASRVWWHHAQSYIKSASLIVYVFGGIFTVPTSGIAASGSCLTTCMALSASRARNRGHCCLVSFEEGYTSALRMTRGITLLPPEQERLRLVCTSSCCCSQTASMTLTHDTVGSSSIGVLRPTSMSSCQHRTLDQREWL